MKQILLISLNFYPEDTAIGLYSTQMALFLAEKNNIEVLTAYPYYPEWEITHGYKKKTGYQKEPLNEITIHRHKQYIPKKINFLGRVKLMLSYSTNLIKMFFKPQKPDVVICIIPFTLSCYIGWLYKLAFRSKVWIHIQDFEFDAAIESGLIKNRFLKKTLLSFERFILNRADKISTISPSMVQQLSKKTSTDSYFLPNWIDESIFMEQRLKTKHPYFQNNNKFSILYSGNIGEKQDWDLFLQLVNSLKEVSQIEFIIVGNGAKRKWLESELKDFINVRFHELVAFSELPILLHSASAHILLQKIEVKDSVMPSKVLGMLASGKPSIISGNKNSALKEVMQTTGNFYFHNGDAKTIHTVIQKLISNQFNLNHIREKSIHYVQNNYSRLEVLNHFYIELTKLFEKSSTVKKTNVNNR